MLSPVATVRIEVGKEQVAFPCAEGARILHAGLACGAPLPYECASGTCGKCRASLVEGDVRELWPEAPGRAALRPARREILMCQSTPAGDVALAVARAARVPSPLPRARAGHLREVRHLAPDVAEINVALDVPMTFAAGQFVLLEAAGLDGPRAYSMVNYDVPAPALRLVVRRKFAGGFSKWLFAGDRVDTPLRVFGPLGVATFDATVATDVVCIAGGSGVAGMMSIVRSALAHGHFARHRLDLSFGVRTPADLFYADELSELRRLAGERLGVTIALSEDRSPPPCARYPLLRFATGLVHDVAMQSGPRSLADVTAFLAGPPPAVDAGVRALLAARVPLSRIRYDKFA